jgi:hypothetical protein
MAVVKWAGSGRDLGGTWAASGRRRLLHEDILPLAHGAAAPLSPAEVPPTLKFVATQGWMRTLSADTIF